MSQQTRNNPGSPEMEQAARDNQRTVFASWMQSREPVEERDLEEDAPPRDTARSRFLDGVDSGTNREYL